MTEFEKMGCTYRQEGDYFLPNLKIGEQDEVLHRHPGSASDKPLYLRNKAGRGRGIYPRITKESRQNACSPKEA